jgi:mannosyl-oligosaccharide glucosidase
MAPASPLSRRVRSLVVAFSVFGLTVVTSNASNASWQTWGPYRPNLYFGVRPQVPETLLMGLMWASGDSRDKLLSSEY